MPTPVCVILATHNNPRALEYSLAGFARQDFRDFEIVIADDGSGPETREVVDRARTASPVPIIHVWQPHPPWFGKPAILNKAIVTAESDYLILADGDVVPRHDFVRAHWELKRPRCFLAGGDFRLSPEATAALSLEDIADGRAFTRAYLLGLGQPRTKKFVKLLPRSVFTKALDAVNFSPARWSGSNASAWRDDLLRVDGVDETFRLWGKEDTELGIRLWNDGVRSRHVRHNAICLHLWHGAGGMSDEAKRVNLAMIEETRRTRRTRARIGISAMSRDFSVDWGSGAVPAAVD